MVNSNLSELQVDVYRVLEKQVMEQGHPAEELAK